MRRVVFAVPGDLATPTGGYHYDRRMIEELRGFGWQVEVIDLGEGFPRPDAATKAAAEAQLKSVPRGYPIVVDGLAFGVLPEAAPAVGEDHPLIALVHHPLALESGLSRSDADALRASERAALAATRGVIVTSASTARIVQNEFGVARERITVALPGTDRGAMAQGSSDGVVRLLSVGAVVQRKGFDILLAALATLPDLPWRLTIAGDRSRDPAAAARLDSDIARFELSARIDILGALPREKLLALYAASDVFVSASRFEGYGMAFAEAIVHGLPVIGTTGGAIPDTVPASAGLLAPPGDAVALAEALRRLIAQPGERRRLAAGARAAAAQLPTWTESAKRIAAAIEAVA